MSGGFPAPSDGSIPASIINGVDQIRLAQWHFAMYATRYLEEITRGVAYGTQDSRFTNSDLLDISLANVESYAQQHIQCLQTLIANKNLLIATGTANAIVLETKIIDDSLENGDYAKNAPLPLNFRDGLELDFVATANNTGAVTISIPSFQGVNGALDIVKQDLTPLIEGDIKIGYRYTIICDQTNDRFILKNSFFREATTTTQGIVYANKPIILTYSSPTTLLYSNGTFQFDDGTGQGVVTAGSVDLTTNGMGGLDTGSIQPNATYFLHAYKNNTTGAFGVAMSTSPTTSTISGWTRVARIRGAVLMTNASSQIIQGTWYKGGKFQLTIPIEVLTAFTQSVNTETLRTVVAPSGIKTQALLAMKSFVSTGTTAGEIRFNMYSPDVSMATLLDNAYTNSVLYYNTTGTVLTQSNVMPIITNTSSQIKTNAKRINGNNNGQLSLVSHGWVDDID